MTLLFKLLPVKSVTTNRCLAYQCVQLSSIRRPSTAVEEATATATAEDVNYACLRSPLSSDGPPSHSETNGTHYFNGYRRLRGSRRRSFPTALRDTKKKLLVSQQAVKREGAIILRKLGQTKANFKKRVERVIEPYRENIWTIPNILCVTRIFASPYLGYLILEGDYTIALIVLGFAGVTDLLDGLIARHVKEQSSKLGSFLDPLADKILIATMFLTLTYAELMPLWLTSVIVVRDVSLAAAGFYIRYMSLPPPRTLSRYFDPTFVTAQLAPTFISKLNTAVQLSSVAITLTAPVFDFMGHPYLLYLWYLTGATTVLSAGSYVFSKNTYKLLHKKTSK